MKFATLVRLCQRSADGEGDDGGGDDGASQGGSGQRWEAVR